MPTVPAGVIAAENRIIQGIRDHLTISAAPGHKYSKGAERVKSGASSVNHVGTPRFCIVVVVAKQLMADEFTNDVSLLPDGIWRAPVVEVDQDKTPSGNVLAVSNDDELLV